MTYRTRPLVVLVLIGTLVLIAQVSTAVAEPDNEVGGDDPRALELVRQSATAAARVSYIGTQYVASWSTLGKNEASNSAVVQVLHRAGGDTTVRVQGEEAAILQDRDSADWLADGGGPAELLAGAYDVRLSGVGLVAGRSADLVEALRHDGSVAARLWLDRETALPLRRETFDADGSLLGASAFVELTVVDVEPCCDHDADTQRTADVETSMLGRADLDRLRGSGWHCPEMLPDGLALYEARQLGDAVHLSYSDGVMNVSVFEQPGRLDPQSLEGYAVSTVGDGPVYSSAGPPARFTWSSGGRVVTVVADAPLEVVDTLLAALPPDAPPEPDDDGFFDRLARGAQRVGSWLNPFD